MTLDTADLRLSWRLTPSWNCCRRRRSCTLTKRSKWCWRLLSAVYSVCPIRWFRVSSVLRADVAEDDRTVRKNVPESTSSGAAIRTDVCDGGLWEASVARFQHVYPDAGIAGCWFLRLIWCHVVRLRSRVLTFSVAPPLRLRFPAKAWFTSL